MTKPPKKRAPGRPALPTSEKKARNFTFRSRGDMHERLSASAAAKERSISEEIEARLTASFEIDKRIAEFKELSEQRVKDIKEVVAEAEATREQLIKEYKEAIAETEAECERALQKLAKLDVEFKKAEISAAMIDALLGENEASRDLLRKIALEVMNNPVWDRSRADRQAMAARIQAYVFPPDSLESDSDQQVSGA